MVRLTFLVAVLVSICSVLHAREVPPVVKHIQGSGKAIPVISGFAEHFLPDSVLEKQLRNERQYLILNNDRLYVKVNGTGRMYEVRVDKNDLRFVRQDSTFYLGDNFYAFNFSYLRRILSYGGYGFWRNNGFIRWYDTVQHEWDVMLSDKVVRPSRGSVVWLDDKMDMLYVFHDWQIENNKMDSGGMVLVSDHLYCLDLQTLKWADMGSLGKTYWNTNELNLNSPWGALVIWNHFSIGLLDPRNNRHYEAREAGLAKLRKVIQDPFPELLYFIDSTLYFGNVSNGLFDSIRLSINDFKPVGQLYTPRNDTSRTSGLLGGGIAILGLGIAAYAFWRKSVNPGSTSHNKTKVEAAGKAKGETFNETEKGLLMLMLTKVKVNETASIDEINRVLGLTNKTEAIQKKNRSDVINSINEKWALVHGGNTPLILRQRSEFDKRSYEYFIGPEWRNANIFDRRD